MIGLKFRGRPPIRLAETVKDVIGLKNEYAAAIMDRSTHLDDDIVAAIMGQSLMTWEGRNPAPALDFDGNFQGTDFDLFSFLVPLVDRGAVIEISRYRNRRKIVRRANERKVGSNQFGKLIGLTSHKNAHSFSLKIRDETIIRRDPKTEREQIGAPRNYMLVDCDGHWYDGWDRIHWDPTVAENRFLAEKGLWTNNTVFFKYYVHPNRWQSVFGAPYLLQKMLIERIDDEATFYGAEVLRLRNAGMRFAHGEGKPDHAPPEWTGPTKPIMVQSIEMIMDIPEFSGNYTAVATSPRALLDAHQRHRFLKWILKPYVQFCTRADEVAYYEFGANKIAHWMQERTWIHGWKQPPRGRIEWNMMQLSNDVALRYRVKSVTQEVSAQ